MEYKVLWRERVYQYLSSPAKQNHSTAKATKPKEKNNLFIFAWPKIITPIGEQKQCAVIATTLSPELEIIARLNSHSENLSG